MSKPTAKEIHEACIEACCACPGHDTFRRIVGDEVEIVRGRPVPIGRLHELGLKKVIRYWSDTSTIGGSVLFDSGYEAHLPEEIADLLWEARNKDD